MHEAQTQRESCQACRHIGNEHTCEACFVTLTYNDEHLPKDYGLDPTHAKAFVKALQKLRPGKIRYFLVGEYGDENKRPHYHAIVFGIDFSEDRIQYSTNERGEKWYISENLNSLWKRGFTTIGGLSRESAQYVARYALKKITGQLQDFAYLRTRNEEYWWVHPEFQRMSLKPGIGAKWLDKYHGDIYPSDETIIDGKRLPTPRYYDKRLAQMKSQEALETVKKARRKRAERASIQLTPERRAATAEIMRAKQATRRI